MDTLIKQTKRKNPASKDKTGEIKVPARKSVSFKEDKKKSPNWLQKQFSKQMSDQFYDPINDLSYDPISDMDHAAAVAATAYVITTLDETWLESYHTKQSGFEHGASFARSKSRREDAFPEEPRSLSRRFSEQLSFTEAEMNDNKRSPVRKSPSVKKTPTFSTNLRGDHTKQSEDSWEEPPAPMRTQPPVKTRSKRHAQPPPPPPPPSPPPLRLPPREIKRQTSQHTSRKYDSIADAWEKTELAKIKAKYEKLNRKIDLWEAKKRDKARRKLDKSEQSEQEQRRKRGLQRFREDTEYIEQIVAGARAQAEKQKQSQEFKVKEKTSGIRNTGKVPGKACLCF